MQAIESAGFALALKYQVSSILSKELSKCKTYPTLELIFAPSNCDATDGCGLATGIRGPRLDTWTTSVSAVEVPGFRGEDLAWDLIFLFGLRLGLLNSKPFGGLDGASSPSWLGVEGSLGFALSTIDFVGV